MYVRLLLPIPRPSPRLNSNHTSDMIDKATKEIKQDEDKIVYKNLDDIAEDLPDNVPRFIILSYPVTLVNMSKCFLQTSQH